MVSDDLLRYRAYLLRLWPTDQATWRASLEDPHTGQRQAFASLALLMAFLEEVTGSRAARASQSIDRTSADTT